jgi:hypothetical protein
VIADPPSLKGILQETTDWVDAALVADTPLGESGVAAGTTEADAVEAAPVPDAFVAVTAKV